jgi:hypothetical protein
MKEEHKLGVFECRVLRCGKQECSPNFWEDTASKAKDKRLEG